MAKMGSFSVSGLKQLQQQMNKLQQGDVQAFVDSCARELAARLLAEVIKRTPVGDYSKEVEVVAKRDSKNHKKGDIYTKRVNPDGKMGGTLRRGWTSKTHEEAESGSGKSSAQAGKEYAKSLKIHHFDNYVVVEIANPVEYASYVEFGHRTANKKGWVRGKFMMTKSKAEIEKIAPNVLQAQIKKFLEGCMK